MGQQGTRQARQSGGAHHKAQNPTAAAGSPLLGSTSSARGEPCVRSHTECASRGDIYTRLLGHTSQSVPEYSWHLPGELTRHTRAATAQGYQWPPHNSLGKFPVRGGWCGSHPVGLLSAEGCCRNYPGTRLLERLPPHTWPRRPCTKGQRHYGGKGYILSFLQRQHPL